MTNRNHPGVSAVAGWVFAAAAGLLAVAVVAALVGFYQAALLGLAVFGVAGLVVGFPARRGPDADRPRTGGQ